MTHPGGSLEQCRPLTLVVGVQVPAHFDLACWPAGIGDVRYRRQERPLAGWGDDGHGAGCVVQDLTGYRAQPQSGEPATAA
jgi:hypothetical protein